MHPETPKAGLREVLVTHGVQRTLDGLDETQLVPELGPLSDADAADRVSRHVAQLVADAVETAPEHERAALGTRLAAQILRQLDGVLDASMVDDAIPSEPGSVLHAFLSKQPDGTPGLIERPLTPLLDTTVFTNAPGEPTVGHELRAEIDSAESIDVVMAFIRWSGVRPLMDALKKHCRNGKTIRVLTTTYTNSTEQRALEELTSLGAQVRVSYDTTMTRLHAKAWIFHRAEGYSTAYVGSSNLTHSAQVTGLEWNVRLSGVRNPDALAKIAAVFASYWEGRDFVPYDSDEFKLKNAVLESLDLSQLSPFEIELRPFQERLLELVAVSRHQGHSKNLLVAATGTGKTVMAAFDYARVRGTLPRDRLLFIAHRSEILAQSRLKFRQVIGDPAFGEMWVGGRRPTRFEHVFASIQSLNASGIAAIDAEHFDVVIVDEFHHAAAPSYEALLTRLRPLQLLGLTATPERSDGLDVLKYFDGRIAAELRLWDAIDQQYLVPFAYFGVHDGVDLSEVPWRRGTGYDVAELTNILTADHVWARRVLEQIRKKIGDPGSMRALGFCVSVRHAFFMADQFNAIGLRSVAVSAESPQADRDAALLDLEAGRINVVFAVDLFNEGVDVPKVDTLLFLRPTDSPTLFLQQLGRGLRRAHGKTVCTVLDFVGTHRKEFRFDRRFRALLGGSRTDIERQVKQGFPFLPAGCHLELDAIAQDIVLRSIRESIPTGWRDRCAELRSLGDVSLSEYLSQTGLELDDLYAGNHSWSEMRRAAGVPVFPAGPQEDALLRAVGRLLHVDDDERVDAYASFVEHPSAPNFQILSDLEKRRLRMLVASLTTLSAKDNIQDAVDQLWSHPQVRAELAELFSILRGRADHLNFALELDESVPLRVHARYTRNEIQAAFGSGNGAKPATWQTGVSWDERSRTDLFAFTLDKSVGSFSPTTRYRDYAISPELIHWESQSATSEGGQIGQRYITHLDSGSKIVLFARLRATDRAFWCLGEASYVSHENERPIAFVWRLEHKLPADLYSQFAAAVA